MQNLLDYFTDGLVMRKGLFYLIYNANIYSTYLCQSLVQTISSAVTHQKKVLKSVFNVRPNYMCVLLKVSENVNQLKFVLLLNKCTSKLL